MRKTTPLTPKLEPQLHHWWPKGVSAFWADRNGETTRETPDGKINKNRPENHGAIKNGHHVDLQGPWSHSFEPHFDQADSYFPHLVGELLQLDSRIESRSDYFARAELVQLTNESERLLPECLASLAVRSPRFRQIVRQAVLEFGAYDETLSNRDVIFSSNIGRCFPAIIKSIEHCKLRFVLFSDTDEFAFGDGFFHNLSSWADPVRNARLLIPLTPVMAIAAVANDYCVSPGTRTIRLNKAEVREINQVTQLYSTDCIFYRDQRPQIDPECFNGKFMSLKESSWNFLDRIAAPYLNAPLGSYANPFRTE